MASRILSLHFSVRIPKRSPVKYTLNITVPGVPHLPHTDLLKLVMDRTMTVPGLLWREVLTDYVPGLAVPEIHFHASAGWDDAPVQKTYSAEDICTLTADVKSESIDEQILSGLVATFGQRVYMFVLAAQP